MRNYYLLLIATILVLGSSSAWANTNTTINNTVINPTAVVVKEKTQIGAEADLPNLVKLPWGFYLGAEAGKDFAYTDASKGWFVYGKITNYWTALDLSGDKK